MRSCLAVDDASSFLAIDAIGLASALQRFFSALALAQRDVRPAMMPLSMLPYAMEPSSQFPIPNVFRFAAVFLSRTVINAPLLYANNDISLGQQSQRLAAATAGRFPRVCPISFVTITLADSRSIRASTNRPFYISVDPFCGHLDRWSECSALESTRATLE